MKTRIWARLMVALLPVLTAAWAGAADEVKLPVADPAPVTVAAPPDAVPAAPTPPATPAPAPAPAAPGNDAVRTIQMPKLSLPPLLDQVVRLSESGTDESVVRAYVEKAAPPYRITGNEILQLRDLGVPQSVILSLIEHSQSAAPSTSTEMIGPNALPNQAAPAAVQPAPGEATAPLAAPEFYDALAPYGSWVDVPGYGLCWQPVAGAISPGWRPYCDNGDWLWSDSGWYWHSYYSWGWAPFHYGRWFSSGNRGWFWCPDRTWGPAWVCWRNSGALCGWAALPPGARFAAGLGWSFHGAHVGAGFDFGLGVANFTFVGHEHFAERQVAGHALRGNDAVTAFHHTSVVENQSVGANNQFINRGVGRETIAAASHTPVRDVAVRELPRSGSGETMPDRLSRVGNDRVVYRPDAKISVPRQSASQTASAQSLRAVSPSMTATPLHQRQASAGIITGGIAARQSMPQYSMGSRIGTPSAPTPYFGRQSAPFASLPHAAVPSYSIPHSSVAPSYGHNSFGHASSSLGGGGAMSHAGGAVSHGGGSVGHASASHR